MKQLKSVIDLEDADYVQCDLEDTGTGECLSKKVPLQSYLKMLAKASDSDACIIPRLPSGTLGGLRYFSDSSFYMEVYVEADVHPTAYMKPENMVLLPFPSLIFMISVKNGKMESSRVYAVREKYRAVNDETELYMFPYGNVYDTGRVCWGSNFSVFNVPSVTDVEEVIGTFFSAVMNNDLYNMNTKRRVPLEQLIDEAAQKTCFDEGILLPMGTLSKLRKLY